MDDREWREGQGEGRWWSSAFQRYGSALCKRVSILGRSLMRLFLRPRLGPKLSVFTNFYQKSVETFQYSY